MSGNYSDLQTALVELDEGKVEDLVSQKLSAGDAPLDIVEQMRYGMIEIGDRFGEGIYYLSELIMASEIFSGVMKVIGPLLEGEAASSAGEVVFATVKGDVHDIGKNIVVSMLRGNGFHVHDLGVDVPPERIVEKLQETGAELLGLSALLTTSFDAMKETVFSLQEAGLRGKVKVMIGGGPTNEKVREFVGADAVGDDAHKAVLLARKLSEV